MSAGCLTIESEVHAVESEGLTPVMACDKREALRKGATATKQSITSASGKMDGFAEPVIGRAFARPVGSQ
jgi:hypothetical protein